MAEAKRLLVLNVDIDDDLHEKAKLRGPVVGRKANIEAAGKLATADPQEVDANAMFAAVKLADELSKDHVVEVATITGSRTPGFSAHREVVKQLEKVLAEFSPEACVFVSDGAADEQVLPLVTARVKVLSVQTLVMKQTKELEKTYFVVLEKLKEPAFARVVFGVPGVALLLYFLVGNVGLRYFVGLLGLYLILKGLGVEEWVARRLESTQISFDRISSVFYFAAIPLGVVAIAIGVSKATGSGQSDVLKIAAIFVKEQFLLVIAGMLTVVGQALEAYYEKKEYLYPGYLIAASSIVLFWLLFSNAADWIIGTASFADFFSTLLLIVVVMFLVIYLAKEFRKDLISRLHLEGREVYTEVGTQLGTVVGVNKVKDTFIVETEAGSKIDLGFDHIAHLGDKVIIRY